jgi:hypothetical protein
MTQTILTRLDNLYDVLEYCSNQQAFGKPACFTVLERICINQERGSLLSQINQDNQESDKRHYKCPPKLESKIRFIIQKVIDINLITN